MEITAHRALSLIKSTKERLDKALRDGRFFDIRMGESTKINGETVESVESSIKSANDTFLGLYNNLIQLRSALALSNAGITKDTVNITKKKLSMGEFTVTEIIIRNEMQTYYEKYLLNLEKAYNTHTVSYTHLRAHETR